VPELPEVESLRLSLLPKLLGRTVTSARLFRRDILVAPGDPVGGFSRQRTAAAKGSLRLAIRPKPYRSADLLVGSTITALTRHGKQLAILTPDRAMIVQLGMTGSIDFLAPDEKRDTHAHALWTLDTSLRFRFHDPRRFGSLRIFRSTADLNAHWSTLGPDALTITDEELRSALADTRRPIKAALLDQSILAGVGNIYADESLFLARVHPATIAAQIPSNAVARLADAIRSTLAAAVTAGGSTLRDYTDANGSPGTYVASHRVYGRGGLACLTCGSKLSHALLAQRTTVWCPQCQHHPKSRPRR
jgi:formamidopyrimidine-DNA glycosylase